MRSNALVQLGESPILEQLSGSDKGQVFELKADRITIGRNDNNDIVIVGEAVSRYHACVEKDESGGFYVRDQGSKNGVQVNNVTVGEAALKDGDLVQIGSFMFRFRAPIGSELPDHAGESEAEGEYAGVPQMSSRSAGPKSKRPLLYGAVGLVLFLVVYMTNDDGKKPDAATGGDAAAQNNGLPVLPQPSPPPPFQDKNTAPSLVGSDDPLLRDSGDPNSKKTIEAEEAEQYYKKGLREYTDENYHRAIELFRTALTLNRQHAMASYYLQLTYFEVETLANKNFEIGRKYFEAMHYQRSIYHFGEVISLLSHRPGDDKRTRESGTFICQAKKRLGEVKKCP